MFNTTSSLHMAWHRRSKGDAGRCLFGMYVSAFSVLLWRDNMTIVLLACIFISIFLVRLSILEWSALRQHILKAAVLVGPLDLALSVSPLSRNWHDVLSYQPLILYTLCHLSWMLFKHAGPHDGTTRKITETDTHAHHMASTTQSPRSPIEILHSSTSSLDTGSMGVDVGSPPRAQLYSNDSQHTPRLSPSGHRYHCDREVAAMTSADWHQVADEEAEDILRDLIPTVGKDWDPAVKDIVLGGRDESEVPRDQHRHW